MIACIQWYTCRTTSKYVKQATQESKLLRLPIFTSRSFQFLFELRAAKNVTTRKALLKTALALRAEGPRCSVWHLCQW